MSPTVHSACGVEGVPFHPCIVEVKAGAFLILVLCHLKNRSQKEGSQNDNASVYYQFRKMLYAFVSQVKCPHQLISDKATLLGNSVNLSPVTFLGLFSQSTTASFHRKYFGVGFLSCLVFLTSVVRLRIHSLHCPSDIELYDQDMHTTKKCSLQNMYALTFYLLISSIK